jgi:hypothetical protein
VGDYWADFRGLLDAASGASWDVVRDSDAGRLGIAVTFVDGHQQELRVTRESERANDGDVVFIGHTRRGAEALLASVHGPERLSAD